MLNQFSRTELLYGKEAMEHFKEIGTVIYLKVSEKELESRLGSLKERGVVSNGKTTIEEIFEDRKRLYEKYADIVITQEGMDIRTIVEDMYSRIKFMSKFIQLNIDLLLKNLAFCINIFIVCFV